MISEKFFRLIALLGLALSLAACGATPTSTEVPLVPAATIRPSLAQTTPAVVQTTQAAKTTQLTKPTQALSDLTAVKSEKTLIKAFTDAQGRAIKLIYGRGNGHQGDYGWAHILGKHFEGIWYDGGIITTYPEAVGAKTPEAVLTLVGKTFEDSQPDEQGGGRRGYVYIVLGTKYDIFSVVGNDGTVITAYPVRHGSKGDD